MSKHDVTQELIEQVNCARTDGSTLEIVGGGSKRFIGREAAADARIDAGRHRGIVSYEPVELVLTARAGTPLQEIEDTLAQQGQMLAFDPPHFAGGATLGGTLACNQSGPARPWNGSVRDAVLGIRLVNGRGEHLRFGGQVMKNVAGYDVSRAQAGALGSLGIITEISLKVMPRPAASMTLVKEMDAARAIVEMNTLAGRPRPLAGACWQDGQLYLRLAGVQAAVAGTASRWGGEVLQHESNFWRDLRDQRQPFFVDGEPLWRFSVNPAAPHWRDGADWRFDWGGAQRWLRGAFQRAELEREAGRAGGQVTLFRGGDRAGEVFSTQSAALQTLHRRLKEAFDPMRIFNPGRLYSWM
ncbi:glycolate oxidase subunit GlcE [Haliea sp. E1-2-M8]|uniref:glycolate oxidase subunit GlcE n=1 Tax=Haliea sp. E1-2-M8 TaxID=3064706 RepID=UPI00271A96E7|nr:glycolate oxidase subunit GlcE [Haliea sp. E1-2-M8]MDO8863806.1 glycolate oxidase subunit GlcE [Haliea sp. E1-2-M8]